MLLTLSVCSEDALDVEIGDAFALDVAEAPSVEADCMAFVVVRIADVSDNCAVEKLDKEYCVLEASEEAPSAVVVASTVEEYVGVICVDVGCSRVVVLSIEDWDINVSVDKEVVHVAAPVIETEVGAFVDDFGVLLAFAVPSDVVSVGLDEVASLVAVMIDGAKVELVVLDAPDVAASVVDATLDVDVSAAIRVLVFGVLGMDDATAVVLAVDTHGVVDMLADEF